MALTSLASVEVGSTDIPTYISIEDANELREEVLLTFHAFMDFMLSKLFDC